MAENVRSWVVPSFTQNHTRYLVTLFDNGEFECTCMKFVMHPNDGDCKHITAVKDGKYKPLKNMHEVVPVISLYDWDCPNCGNTNHLSPFAYAHRVTQDCPACHAAVRILPA